MFFVATLWSLKQLSGRVIPGFIFQRGPCKINVKFRKWKFTYPMKLMHSNNMVLHYRCNLVHNSVTVWNHQSSHHMLWNLALCSAFSLSSEPLTTVLLAVACLTLWHQGWKLPLHVNMNVLSWNMQHFVENKRKLMQHVSESSVNILVENIYEILSVGGGIG